MLRLALVCLVDDDRVVGAKQAIPVQFGEQDAVGHELDQGVRPSTPVGEPHGVPDRLADGGSQLLGDPLGDRAGGQAPWLRVPDHSPHTQAEFQAHLGDLRRLARSGFAGDHDHLVPADGVEDVRSAIDNR